MEYLRSQPFQYTLTPPAFGAQPVDEFLFETREGFCEHYASALTVLLRAAGLPARVVMGYQGGEFNAIGGYYIVRQSDAHAWTEVWLEDEGWVRVDGVAAVAPERVALGLRSFRERPAPLPQPRHCARAGAARLRSFGTPSKRAGNRGSSATARTSSVRCSSRLGFDGLRRMQRSAVLLGLAVAATVALLLGLSMYLAWRQRRRDGLRSSGVVLRVVRALA